MTTSGTITFNETVELLVTDALSLLAVVAAGEVPQEADFTFCIRQLNSMIKAWMAQGIHLFTEESGTIFLIQGQPQYVLSAGNNTNASDGTNTVETTVSIAASGTSIEVASSNNMQIDDTIGICQDNQITTWTTITNIIGTTITIAVGLTNVASVGNAVYSYTNQLPRVLSVQSARLRNNQGFDKMMDIKPREDYMRIPQKLITGDPIILYYSPQVNNGQVYIWPAPSDINKRIEITYLRPLEDSIFQNDTVDFPQEWLEAIKYNLAVRIAPSYGLNLSAGGVGGNPSLLTQAAQYLEDMKAWDTEQPYIQIVPKSQYYPK